MTTIPTSVGADGERVTDRGTKVTDPRAGDIKEQKDMFLKLLVAQLKQQDPSSPMDQKDMMAQMAQFSSVEQMGNMVKSMETLTFNASFSQSVGLIGKNIDYMKTSPDGATSIQSGKVTAVATKQGEIELQMEDGSTLMPGDVVKVTS